MSAIEPASRRVFRAPTSGRTRCTKAAAYREEARARFAATCDCAEMGRPCRYHDHTRWERSGYMSRNGYVIARWACMLAARDGVRLPRPEGPRRTSKPGDHDDDLPF